MPAPFPARTLPRRAAALALLAGSPALVGALEPSEPRYAQMTIHQRLIIRVPRMPAATARGSMPPMWVEKGGTKCVPTTSLTGAAVTRDGDVDLIIDGMQRVRAKLDDDCPTLDFYSGFYLRRSEDGKLCAKRDVLRTRSGAQCAIRHFRKLKLKSAD